MPVAVLPGGAPPPGDGFEAVEARDGAHARELILDCDAYGAIGPEEMLIAPAASPQIAELLVSSAFERDAEVTVVRGLDPDDPRGTSINLTVLPLTVTAIFGALLLFTLAPRLDGPRRVGLIAVFGVLGALASVSAALMRAIGPPGIMLSFLLFLMLGNPGSGAPSAPHLLPDPWSWGGQLLPPGALATGIRNVAYFDGADAARWLTVLLVWAGVGVLALLALRGGGSENRSR